MELNPKTNRMLFSPEVKAELVIESINTILLEPPDEAAVQLAAYAKDHGLFEEDVITNMQDAAVSPETVGIFLSEFNKK